MRRAGGWILGIVAVLAMAAGAWFALRPVFTRETVAVLFVRIGDRGPTNDAVLRGVRYALHESGERAGQFRVDLTEELKSLPKDQRLLAAVGTHEFWTSSRDLACFSAMQLRPHPDSFNFFVAPELGRQGRAAAGWILKSKRARPFLLREPLSDRSEGIARGFQSAAQELGLSVGGTSETDTDRVRLLDTILSSQTDLVFYSGENAPYATTFEIFSALRQRGFTGTLLTAEADPEVSMLVVPGQVVEGTYLISPFAPAPDEFAKGYRDFTGLGAGIHAYYGYFAMKSALEAIDRANSKDPALILQAARKLPYYDAEGETTVHSYALYVARGGRFQFVQLLK